MRRWVEASCVIPETFFRLLQVAAPGPASGRWHPILLSQKCGASLAEAASLGASHLQQNNHSSASPPPRRGVPWKFWRVCKCNINCTYHV